jgi:hypothetical protein
MAGNIITVSDWALLALIPIAATAIGWMLKQILAHANVMTKLSAELESHVEVDKVVHDSVNAMGGTVTDIRLEQVRVATQLASTSQQLITIATAARIAAEAAATAVTEAAAARALVVERTAQVAASVLAQAKLAP